MIYDIMEMLVIFEAVIIGLIVVAAILNRQVLKDAKALGKSVKAGTGMAVDKAVNFFDNDGDGDVDIDDLKYIASNLDVKMLTTAIKKEIQQAEYDDNGAVMDPAKRKNTGEMFKAAVSKKSEGK